jgi:lysophospholipase L1-like esterase
MKVAASRRPVVSIDRAFGRIVGMRYVAIGDSFTEGVGDWREDGTPRGWADRVAEGLAAAASEPVHYANLAIRGRLLAPIATGQVDEALALDPRPDLMTFNGGGNDMLRPGADLQALLRLTRTAVDRCLDAGIQVVLLSGPDPSSGLPSRRAIHARGTTLTLAVKELAAERGLLFVSCWEDSTFHGPEYWCEDRIHLNPHGHARVAHLVLTALGVPSVLGAEPAPRRWRERPLDEVRYYRRHVGPWVGRRLRGRSSGDNRLPKHPTWSLVTPEP